MRVLINIDVPDVERALAFYTQAFGLTVRRRLGGDGVELAGWPAPVFLLRKEAGSIGVADQRRTYERHWTLCISMWWSTTSKGPLCVRLRQAPCLSRTRALPSGAGSRCSPTRSGTASA